jgi:hypothetical protein
VKRLVLVAFIVLMASLFIPESASAQCSICTKTAQQLGEKPAKGLNAGILYLAFAPFAIAGIIAYRWWNKGRAV